MNRPVYKTPLGAFIMNLVIPGAVLFSSGQSWLGAAVLACTMVLANLALLMGDERGFVYGVTAGVIVAVFAFVASILAAKDGSHGQSSSQQVACNEPE